MAESGELSDDLEAWLDERAESTGRDRDEVLARAVSAYRLVARADDVQENGVPGEDEVTVAGEEVSDLGDRLADLDEDVSTLEGRVDTLESDLASHVEDLRERVVQVLRTAEAKADADHEHEALEASLADQAESLEALRDDLMALEERVDGGFENFETVLEGVRETTADLDSKATQLAHAAVDLRRRTTSLEAASARRDAVEDLATEANRHGVTSANCESCARRVALALLSAPTCPHCGSPFDGVEPGGGFLRSATLTVGERPALEGETPEPASVERVFEEDEDE